MNKKSLSILIALSFATSNLLFPTTSVFAAGIIPTTVAPPSTYGITYEGHVQNKGWMDAVTTIGEKTDITLASEAGTNGQGLRVEALKLSGTNLPAGASITYQAHVQNKGWMPAVTTTGNVAIDAAAEAGTDGQGLRVEAFKITLKGLPGYAVNYETHVQNKGWMPAIQTANGTEISLAPEAGTHGLGLRMEALRIEIIKTETEKAAEITAINAVTKAETTNATTDITAATVAVHNVAATAEKTSLTNRITNINDVAVNSVGAINDINVAYGTTKDKVGLPSKVTLKLSNSNSEDVAVTWTNATYDGTKASSYTFTGSYTLPTGVSGTMPVIIAKVIVGSASSNGGPGSGNGGEDPAIAYSHLKAGVEAKVATYEGLANGDLLTQTKVNAANVDKSTIVFDNLTDVDKIVFQARIATADLKVIAAQKVITDSIAISIQSVSVINVNTIQVVLVTTPSTDLTVLDAAKFAVTINKQAVVAPIKVTKVSSDITGKTYDLTIAILSGQQGDITVNGTKAVVPTGMVYGFDYQAPTLQSVTAEGPNTIELQFSEKLNPADTNISRANFTVYGNLVNTISVKAVELDSTGTKLILTLRDYSSTISNCLTVADYIITIGNTMTLENVSDIAGNGIYNGTQIIFRPTVEQLQNTDALANRNLTFVKFSKPVNNLTAQTVSNYVIKDINGIQLAVTRAVILPLAGDGTETVYLTTANQVTGTPYTVTTSNIKDKSGSMVTDDTTSFIGSSTVDLLSNVPFPDKNLEQVIRADIEKPNGDILNGDINKIQDLTINDENIADISGIENLTNLNTLNLNVWSINDFEALSELTNLTTLRVTGKGYYSNFDPNSLKSLTNLTTLSLTNNYWMYSLESLTGLTNLTTLDLSNNHINDIDALKGLDKLTTLDLSNNNISNIDALKKLTKLTTLDLSNNPISKSDITLLKSTLHGCDIKSENITGVSLNKDAIYLIVGGIDTLIATVSPADATNKSVTWISSDPSVATIDNTGKVTAISVGTAQLSVTTVDGRKTTGCYVSVTNPVVNVSLDKSTDSIIVGGTDFLTATVNPADATNKAVTWTSSNPSEATVDNNGKVTAISSGTVTITVTTVDGSKTATCEVSLTGPEVSVTTVSLNKTTDNLIVGGIDNLITTINPASATNKDVNWSSSDTSIATVDNTGKVTAISAGTATIRVTTVDGSKTATCDVINANNSVVNFGDSNLEKAVRSTINKPNGVILKSDVVKITQINAASKTITDISGLENLTNLNTINLSNNQITDISELNGLTNLTVLNLEGNRIIDISELNGLTNLTNLDLFANEIIDISVLHGLTNLTTLNLQFNKIININALEGLTNLTNLNLYYNKIADISMLNGLTNLRILNLQNNQITDLAALDGSINLVSLNVADNFINDISALNGLNKLQNLDLHNNYVNDAGIQAFRNALPNCSLYNN